MPIGTWERKLSYRIARMKKPFGKYRGSYWYAQYNDGHGWKTYHIRTNEAAFPTAQQALDYLHERVGIMEVTLGYCSPVEIDF